MKLFNTLTREKEEFVPIKPGEVKMYSCGPTVYNYFHIGNARPFIIFDTLRRYLEYQGYKVRFVQNFTDIDDKMINKANELGITVKELADKYIEEYFIDAKGLGIHHATVHPRATENIDAIIDIIQKLVDSGYAYNVDGDVYYSTKKFKSYGKLSHQPLEDLESGARIEVNEDKHEPMDFALWKKQKPGEPAWESPWGMGRPGWHIECSCIGIKHLGEYMDIHCGGVDNIFPHHTNEIAQSESYLGHKWCPYWFHVNHLNDQTGKMSKSKGDFLTVSLLESKGYDPLAYRMFCLQSHYRKPLVFSYDNLDNVESAYEKLVKKIATFKDEGEMEQEAFEAFRKKFADAIRDDLNTSMALTIVYDVVKADISEKTKLALLNDFDQVLALNLTTAGQERLDAGTSVDAELEQFINEKIAERAGAKKAKDFARADAIRDELLARGITIKDTREGVVWERNA